MLTTEETQELVDLGITDIKQIIFVAGLIESREEQIDISRQAARHRKRRYRERLNTTPSAWERLRKLVFSRDGHRCVVTPLGK